MKTIAIYCVNYHSYDSLYNYLTSIDTAAKLGNSNTRLSVYVADNTVPPTTINYSPQNFTLKILGANDNKGYFGAVRQLMEKFSPYDFDYSIISNVDVLLTKDFITTLSELTVSEETGWLAPAILSETLNFDFNPQALKPYSLCKMQMLRLMFRYPLLLKLKQRILHKYHDIKSLTQQGPIYAGHGSFIILTKAFFNHCGIINYPIFLYGEEIYLAETCRQNGLLVEYIPQMKVKDIGRVSTGHLSSKTYCQYNYKAIDYLIRTFYSK